MIYQFTSKTDNGAFITLSTDNNEEVLIPKDKYVEIDDESGLKSIKTVGSRATIGTLREDSIE